MSDLISEKLDILIDFKNGKKAPKEDGDVPIYGGNGILGYCNKWNFENILVIGRVGAYCGSVHIVNGRCWVSDNAIAAIPKNQLELEYYYYLLGQLNLNKKHIGSSQPLLTQGILNSIETKISSNVSNRISTANVLSDLDAKIVLNNKINTELEAMAKLIYDYWFVQFDFPDENGKPYKTSAGEMVYNEELKREIPDGWEYGYVNDLYNFQYGLGNTNPDNGGMYPIYGSNGVIGGYNEYNNEDAPVIGHIGNNCGSLIYAYGKHYVTYNGVMCKIKEPYDKFFGYCTLLSKDLKRRTRGSSQKFISYDLINQLDFIIPSKKVMKLFCDLIVPSYEKVIINKKENQKLAELRDWLLPMLMNGQVKVK